MFPKDPALKAESLKVPMGELRREEVGPSDTSVGPPKQAIARARMVSSLFSFFLPGHREGSFVQSHLPTVMCCLTKGPNTKRWSHHGLKLWNGESKIKPFPIKSWLSWAFAVAESWLAGLPLVVFTGRQTFVLSFRYAYLGVLYFSTSTYLWSKQLPGILYYLPPFLKQTKMIVQ